MDIDITDFVRNTETWGLSGSVATHGPNVARNTWEAAKDEAGRAPMLNTEDELQALRDHVQAMGFGDEVQGYGPQECNALFLQLITGDMREIGLEDCEPDEFDWKAYEAEAQQGSVPSNIYRCDIPEHASFGRIFFSLSL